MPQVHQGIDHCSVHTGPEKQRQRNEWRSFINEDVGCCYNFKLQTESANWDRTVTLYWEGDVALISKRGAQIRDSCTVRSCETLRSSHPWRRGTADRDTGWDRQMECVANLAFPMGIRVTSLSVQTSRVQCSGWMPIPKSWMSWDVSAPTRVCSYTQMEDKLRKL